MVAGAAEDAEVTTGLRKAGVFPQGGCVPTGLRTGFGLLPPYDGELLLLAAFGVQRSSDSPRHRGRKLRLTIPGPSEQSSHTHPCSNGSLFRPSLCLATEPLCPGRMLCLTIPGPPGQSSHTHSCSSRLQFFPSHTKGQMSTAANNLLLVCEVAGCMACCSASKALKVFSFEIFSHYIYE